MISQQSQVIKTLQDENKSLQKKRIQIAQTSQALRESQTNLTAKINFLKEQVTVLWQNSTDDKHSTNPAIQRPETSTTSEGTMPNIASENRLENPEPQATETGTPSQVITPNIPTENRFLPLQDGKGSDTLFNRRQEISDQEINSSNNLPRQQGCFPVRF